MIALLLLPALAQAHAPGLSYLWLEGTTLTLAVNPVDLGVDAPTPDPLTVVGPLLATVRADVEARPCRATSARPGDVQGRLAATIELRCPGGRPPTTLTAGYLDRMNPGHRLLVTVDGRAVILLDAAHPTVELAKP